MGDSVRVREPAGPFEAAAVAAVVGHLLETERRARERRSEPANRPPAWVRALQPRNPEDPLAVIRPDHRGDPL